MAYANRKLIRSTPARGIEVILRDILFTIGMFLRGKNQPAKKGLKFKYDYY